MKYISVGDMSQTYLMRRHNVQLKATMSRLSDEMVTGLQQDRGNAVSGDFTALSAIERSLTRSAAFKQVAAEADLLAGTQQDALELIQNHTYEMGSTLVSSASTSVPAMIDAGTKDAAQRFESILGAMNVNVAGRYAFSGISTDTLPVASAETITSALAATIGGLTQVEQIVTAVDDWFNAAPGAGGYLDTAYFGSDTTVAPLQLSETDLAEFSITAADPVLRDTLKGFSLASLIAEGHVPDDLATRSALTQAAGEWIITADGNLSTLRSELGTTESIIAAAQTRNSSQKSALEIAKGELIGADAYESATALEAVQAQLETLYTLTTRLSQLSLTDYLR